MDFPKIMKLQPKTLEKLRNLINEETEYRSGPLLVKFFNNLGFRDSYGQGFPARWAYTDEKLNKINGTSAIEACIKQLLSPVNFIGKVDILDTFIEDFNKYLTFDGYKIVKNGKDIVIKAGQQFEPENAENKFIHREFKDVSINNLNLNSVIIPVLNSRLDEIKKCMNAKAPLAVIFLCGSTLEGILLGIAENNQQQFNQASASPKDSSGKVYPFYKWKLANFIDISHEIGLIGADVKKFGHSLRDFRNYIHPYEQMSTRFNPDEHTALICWQVLQAAIADLSKKK